MLYFFEYTSPLGKMRLEGDEKALTGLYFEGQAVEREDENAVFARVGSADEVLPFKMTAAWLDIYFDGRDPSLYVKMPPLCPRGRKTPFRAAVWDAIKDVPYGGSMTYGDVAERLSHEGLCTGAVCARAVGGAVSKNPISLLIPCHRILGKGGKITGYAGGVWRKRELLRLENITFCE